MIAANRSHSRDYWSALDHPLISDPPMNIEASVQRCLTTARAILSIGDTIPHSWKSLFWYANLMQTLHTLPTIRFSD
jgi:hypothetical protein